MPWLPFLMDGNHIGVSREGSSVRDENWIIGGCGTPVLLSPQTDSPSHYRIKGEVLLNGFMFGELQGGKSSPPDGRVKQIILV